MAGRRSDAIDIPHPLGETEPRFHEVRVPGGTVYQVYAETVVSVVLNCYPSG